MVTAMMHDTSEINEKNEIKGITSVTARSTIATAVISFTRETIH